jgi:hypothetical protein
LREGGIELGSQPVVPDARETLFVFLGGLTHTNESFAKEKVAMNNTSER